MDWILFYSHTEYWLFIDDLKWEKVDVITWGNWAPGEEPLLESSDCGRAHINNNHTWTGDHCTDFLALPLCQIEGISLLIVSFPCLQVFIKQHKFVGRCFRRFRSKITPFRNN